MLLVRLLSTLCICFLICSCREDIDEWLSETPTVPPSLRINEVMVRNGSIPFDEKYVPWVEIVNIGNEDLYLYDFLFKTGTNRWQLPDVYLPAGGYYVAHSLESVDGTSSTFLADETGELELVRKSDDALIDSVLLHETAWDESIARLPNGTGRTYTYPPDKVSIGAENPDLGFVRKVSSSSAFKPRDSSPNAILTYRDHYWILGGWSNFSESWHSYTDVWKSPDGVRWELVNPEPPYIHYSSFVVWKDRMWAIGFESFSSTDGVHWTPEPITSGIGNRSVVFHDALINFDGSVVKETRDGVHWNTLTDAAPWGSDRIESRIVVYRGRIWVIGGITGYGQPDAVIHKDVWASSDGVDWELITSDGNWPPRIWQSVHVHDDKIFMFNGANGELWPDEHGNRADIWFTDNGSDWFELPSEYLWEARHASFVTRAHDGSLLIIAGYGHGGVTRIYNDVWTFKASIYFPKPTGDLNSLSTWGKNHDGSGSSPRSFHGQNQIFMLRNRDFVAVNPYWSVTGAGSRIVIGDGDESSPIWFEVTDEPTTPRRLYLHSNSKVMINSGDPEILYKHSNAEVLKLVSY